MFIALIDPGIPGKSVARSFQNKRDAMLWIYSMIDHFMATTRCKEVKHYIIKEV